MKDFSLVATGNIKLLVKESNIKFSDDVNNEIEKIWNKLSKQNNSLFDGISPIVLNIKNQINTTLVECTFINYKTIIADRLNPTLNININQIGVSGVLILNDDTLVFGQRSNSLTEYPSMLELIPSGNLDMKDTKNGQIDYISKLKKEFEEETGISDNIINSIQPLCLVKDHINRTFDVCCKLHIDKNSSEFFNLFYSNDEYQKILLIPFDDLDSFLSKNDAKLVPTSKAILKNLC